MARRCTSLETIEGHPSVNQGAIHGEVIGRKQLVFAQEARYLAEEMPSNVRFHRTLAQAAKIGLIQPPDSGPDQGSGEAAGCDRATHRTTDPSARSAPLTQSSSSFAEMAGSAESASLFIGHNG